MGLFGFGRKKPSDPPASSAAGEAALRSRYAGKPLLIVLDNYILECLGKLPADKRAGIAAIVRKTFGGGEDWQKTVRNKLKLDDSLDQTIRQAWAKFQVDYPGVDPVSFAFAFSDRYFVPLVEPTPSHRGDVATDPAQQREAQERRNRSLAILRQHNVPFMERLPTIEPVATAKIRSPGEVARRATVLSLVAAYAEPRGFPLEQLKALLEERGVANDLTPKEHAFISLATPTDHQRAQFTWRYEAVNALLWALGLVEELTYPAKICDVPAVVRIISQSDPSKFIAEATLRDAAAVLDETDLIYRYDWACVNARVKKQPAPAGLDAGIVVERHYALNWLIGYGGRDWDDVSSDT